MGGAKLSGKLELKGCIGLAAKRDLVAVVVKTLEIESQQDEIQKMG